MERKKTLGEYVVVALATNPHANSYDSALKIIKNMTPGHRLIFLTAHGSKGADALNDKLRALPEQCPFATIADWDDAISGKGDLLAPDKQHIDGQKAIDIYIGVIKKAVEEAAWKPTS
jgi:hypothetical protein